MVAMGRLDPHAIAELRDLMGEEFDALIEAFRSDSQKQVEAIDAAAMRNDAESVRRQAHGLKGACINLGAVDLAELCGRIEDIGRAGDCGTALALLVPLHREFDAVSAALDGLRA
jgi:HPt (histidine-containing phosphotransfer) domain-containing protein